MDAGWYKQKTDSWNSIGDWNVNEEAFPQGLRAAGAQEPLQGHCNVSPCGLQVKYPYTKRKGLENVRVFFGTGREI